ncbi:HTH domain-containing protein [Halobacteriales archaeon Cl-PHB]
MTGETIVTEPWWESFQSTLAARESHRLELFVRSLAPVPGTHRQRTNLVKRLHDLAATGQVDAFDVTVLGEQLCLCDACLEAEVAQTVVDRLTELREWGGETATALGFQERTVDCSITGEAYTVLQPPTLSLAVYVEDDVAAVFPARIGGQTYDVADFVEALGRAEAQPELSRADA